MENNNILSGYACISCIEAGQTIPEEAQRTEAAAVPKVSKEELEEVARDFIDSISGKLSEKDILYYLSGYFKNESVYIADLLAVLAQLQKEYLIKASY